MAYSCFDVDIADQVAHVRLSRPDALNTMTPEFWRELPEIVTGISDDASARVVVLSSTGRHFSAGMDLSVFGGGGSSSLGGAGGGALEPGRRHARTRSHARVLQWSFTALEKARVPVIAAVQGGVIGGAVDLVTACDLRYATEDAFFCVQEINIGMTADVGTLQRLGKVVPEGFAREMAFTGRRVPAQRAYEVGLVQEVYADHESLLEGVLDTAREIAAHSPAGRLGHQGRDELRPRPHRRRRAGADRDLAGRHVPAGRHGGGVHRQAGEARAGLPRAAAGAEGPVARRVRCAAATWRP